MSAACLRGDEAPEAERCAHGNALLDPGAAATVELREPIHGLDPDPDVLNAAFILIGGAPLPPDEDELVELRI